jgi:hypothetical protein
MSLDSRRHSDVSFWVVRSRCSVESCTRIGGVLFHHVAVPLFWIPSVE